MISSITELSTCKYALTVHLSRSREALEKHLKHHFDVSPQHILLRISPFTVCSCPFFVGLIDDDVGHHSPLRAKEIPFVEALTIETRVAVVAFENSKTLGVVVFGCYGSWVYESQGGQVTRIGGGRVELEGGEDKSLELCCLLRFGFLVWRTSSFMDGLEVWS
ncbi:hypothetical protein Drorol1_Dr00012430 [Drosera rotundifolia]